MSQYGQHPPSSPHYTAEDYADVCELIEEQERYHEQEAERLRQDCVKRYGVDPVTAPA